MKVKVHGKNVQLLARIIISLNQFHGLVNVRLERERMVLYTKNYLNGRSVKHIFKNSFFSVQDSSDIASDLSVNIKDIVDTFENIAAMEWESDEAPSFCLLEIVDNRIIINFNYLNDAVKITLCEAAVHPMLKLEYNLKVNDKENDDVFDSNLIREDSLESLGPNLFVSGDTHDTPEIEELITHAETVNMPEHILKTMKEYKKNRDGVIVID
jgi:hypothetical protein